MMQISIHGTHHTSVRKNENIFPCIFLFNALIYIEYAFFKNIFFFSCGTTKYTHAMIFFRNFFKSKSRTFTMKMFTQSFCLDNLSCIIKIRKHNICRMFRADHRRDKYCIDFYPSSSKLFSQSMSLSNTCFVDIYIVFPT